LTSNAAQSVLRGTDPAADRRRSVDPGWMTSEQGQRVPAQVAAPRQSPTVTYNPSVIAIALAPAHPDDACADLRAMLAQRTPAIVCSFILYASQNDTLRNHRPSNKFNPRQ
jgi:hypothetical protein